MLAVSQRGRAEALRAQLRGHELGLRFFVDTIDEVEGDFIVAGRVEDVRSDGRLSRAFRTALLWEHEDGELIRVRQFRSKESALEFAQSHRNSERAMS